MQLIYEFVLEALAAGKRAVLVTAAAVEGGPGQGQEGISQEGQGRRGGFFPPPGGKRFFSPELTAGTLGADWLDQAADELAGRALSSGMLEKARVSIPAATAASGAIPAAPATAEDAAAGTVPAVTAASADATPAAGSGATATAAVTAGHYLLVAEPFVRPDELVILGAGHVARPLAQTAALAGYAVTVVDDRPEFASRERFPEARQVICAGFEQALESLPLGPWTSVVIVTRGHQYDLLCLELLIGRELAYLGMIGSQRKIRLGKEYLLAEGVPEEKIAAVYMPIGLDIGAETPEEIAVSIVAELIKVRRGGAARSLAENEGGGKGAQNRGYLRGGSLWAQDFDLLKILVDCAKQGKLAALATVITARGSSPRKAGAKMLVFPDGSIAGTIGGGAVEEKIRRAALKLLTAGPARTDRPAAPVIVFFSLDGATAAAEGMICGGDVEVLIEPQPGFSA